MTSGLDMDQALGLTRLLFAVGCLVNGAEFLAVRNQYAPGGLFSRKGMASDIRMDWHPGLALLVTFLLSSWMPLVAAGTQVAGALALVLFHSMPLLEFLAVAVCTLGLALANVRNRHGLDGADQMLLIVGVSLCIASLGGVSTRITGLAMSFIALQACLAYMTAGIAKLISPVWRSGSAISFVLDTESYGWKKLSGRLFDWPIAARLASWGVIGFECLFPLSLILGPNVAWFLVIVSMGFHLSCGLIMGLNNFIWAFAASLPSVLWLSGQVSRLHLFA